ncbi:type 1 glutamine amidotransferase [Mariluticola halotolerans]|uniref:type 1 glutamine amidotransferase n=1 Tax=Mariluticola halotolerans TaxID=2909283 RepID=UPI0026E40EEB|nr:type 1 glutamine amidotransferase [Mariluticola halotolerans]UJQ93128.1 type 1 glutamine amidotransferase [Mariluticola halotolerans]
MKLTILQVGECPAPMRQQFGRYPTHFEDMFAATGAGLTFESVYLLDGAPLPDPRNLEGVVITGSAAGVYDSLPWMDPLRAFIRDAYAAKTPTLGICFGHQIMADALGGDVRKSEKGWGLGRQVYAVKNKPGFMNGIGDAVAIAASHQDQVIAPPADAEVFLASDFTPNAGLIYRNGAAMSMQPHPEFNEDFSRGLVELRRNNPLSDDEVEAVDRSLDTPVDSPEVARGLTRFFTDRG